MVPGGRLSSLGGAVLGPLGVDGVPGAAMAWSCCCWGMPMREPRREPRKLGLAMAAWFIWGRIGPGDWTMGLGGGGGACGIIPMCLDKLLISVASWVILVLPDCRVVIWP